MKATSRQQDGVDPAPSDERGEEHVSPARVDSSQQDKDARRQSELTRSVGTRLTRPGNPTSTRRSAFKALRRIAGRRDQSAPPKEREASRSPNLSS
jgi:hypothetical protein